MPSVDSLDALFKDELKDVYDAEKQLTKALPKMAKKASSDDLRQAFEEHLRQTEGHVERLEQVFDELDLPARAKRCVGLRGIIDEGDEMIGEVDDDRARDALLVAAAQKVEHYEIATYGTLCAWANHLGHDDIASILEETLNEEKETDQRLTELAESSLNESAAQADDQAEMRGTRRAATPRNGRQAAADRATVSRKKARR